MAGNGSPAGRRYWVGNRCPPCRRATTGRWRGDSGDADNRRLSSCALTVRPMKTCSANSSPRLGTCPTTTAEGDQRGVTAEGPRPWSAIEEEEEEEEEQGQHEGVVADAEEAQTNPMSASTGCCWSQSLPDVLTVTDSVVGRVLQTAFMFSLTLRRRSCCSRWSDPRPCR